MIIIKKLSIIFIIILSFICSITTTYADVGPKPSVKLDILGLKNKTYYVTLLSKEESTGPFSVIEDFNEISKDKENYDIIKKFYNYKSDYYFLNTFDDCSSTHHYEWNYYPPETFKILIYIKDNDQFICSDSYTRYAFNSYYQVDIKNDKISVSIKNVIQDKPTINDIIKLICRIAATIVIEIIIAYMFHIRSIKKLSIITIVNIITQLGLNITLYYCYFSNLWLPEIVVMLVETIIYKLSFKDIETKYIIMYGIAANFVSYVLGQWLTVLLPNIF